ncbi:hypothetical protein [Oceanobacillus arenosus]|uniref:hypothetical protein n=1 Tax=Oceanobacillus arenosus TaxID=1229153 RepID=UPI001475B173|nr:hypothetical protein [Oceanobacillus arenosus]
MLKMRCPACETEYQDSDLVYLDIGNTVLHQDCVKRVDKKDEGTYKEIIHQYDFFEELR